MNKVYIFAASGMEEVECLTPVDLLRRGGADVVLTAVGGSLTVTGSHGITIQADCRIEDADLSDAAALVLPGGMPGTLNLQADRTLADALLRAAGTDTWICAICAAPRVLGHLGLLQGQTATCYPGVEEHLTGACTTKREVEVSGQFITSRGVGTAIPFALKILEKLEGKDVAEKIEKSIVFRDSL